MSTASSTYADMTNTTRLRSSLRRLFSGQIDEILGEIFQNSQRARAQHVAITTRPDGFTISDDGHGLLGGRDGFWRLLRIAESAFDNPTIDAQDPMGLGIHALLAHGQVQEVTFTSGSLSLTIDTARWWDDQAYYTSWSQRLLIMPQATPGLHITVRCESRLVEALVAALAPRDYHLGYHRCSPAQGYRDLLRIDLNGEPVETRPPRWAIPSAVVLRTTYQGASLVIGRQHEAYLNVHGHSVVNWYGQIITARPLRGFSYYLVVREGRPVNPRSPSRQGMIEDAALDALDAFVEDQIFAYVCDPANRAQLTPDVVESAYALNPVRARRELPYFVAAPLIGINPSESSLDALEQRGAAAIFTYDDPPLLVRAGVRVATAELAPSGPAAYRGGWSSDWEDLLYGLDSFVPTLQAAGYAPHALLCGDDGRLQVADLYWRPGAQREDAFNARGSWGLSWTHNATPATWQPVTHGPVFAFSDPSSCDPESVDWAIGTDDPQAFLHDYVWCAFSPSDDEDYQPQEDAYREGCNAWLRRLIGACVPHAFSYWDLQQQMTDPRSPLHSVTYQYAAPQDGTSQHAIGPIAITVLNMAGEEKRLQLLA